MGLSAAIEKIYYDALLLKDSGYEGVFFVGVKTTGVFCRPTCPARKPKFENCEFFTDAEQALIASYRPCKRCNPLVHPGETSNLIKKLVDAVEEHPEKRWKDKDFAAISIDSVTARRHFKKRFNMTFIQFARARRMGIAFKKIRQGCSVINSQLDAGYESGSGFRDAFSKIMGVAPSRSSSCDQLILKASWLDTILGPMVAISDDHALYLLEFADRRGLEREIEKLRSQKKVAIIPGTTDPISMISSELDLYFSGKLQEFKTPLHLIGSPFQQQAWNALINIPYGQTKSYQEQAKAIGNAKAFRAIANANGANQLAIVIPCHRIINSNGDIGGYGGGKARKKWLLEHEKRHTSPA